MRNITGVVLAAGMGTRMKSELPKVLHQILGRPMLYYILKTLKNMGIEKILVVVGYKHEMIRKAINIEGIEYVVQEPQLGTGHALQVTMPFIREEEGHILVTCGDMPLLGADTLKMLIPPPGEPADVGVLYGRPEEPGDMGRLIFSDDNRIEKIVEVADGGPEIKKIREVNLGAYCFEKGFLRSYLPLLKPSKVKGELYLTDLVQLAFENGLKIRGIYCEDPDEAIGINNRFDLFRAGEKIKKQVMNRLMTSGVTIIDPASTFIHPDTEIGRDTVIHPFTIIEGESKIGVHCQVGPFCRINNSSIGDHTTVFNSVLLSSDVGSHSNIGPFAYLRPGTRTADNVKIGDFVEVKKSFIDEGAKVPHLSYVGDTHIGKGVNIGAGTITCNFDGKRKHKTTIEDNAYIGANTNLVAPVTVGKGAKTGAGAVIINDVPPDSLAVGVPAKIKKKGISKESREK
ncbi:MAG: bifunctional UDP-N-acetylglucosamine diphosphorylase/glucosamine-1-phosphate N-acetyltransferase GlmU [Candidatus Eremiobacteraeota bacterium]|nr:bifunctional UDP-N-acetylglucosamine diphosphorylase/glucosamine-1-phosphate N-acetyltransferase GlmU [Candidatus Eremiobacteraeota bacterium]